MTDFDQINKAFKLESFSGRPWGKEPWSEDLRGFDDYGNLAGVSTTWGPAWREQRKFMQNQLGELGLRKSDKLAVVVGEEAEKMLAHLSNKVNDRLGSIVDFSGFFLQISNNVIWRLLTGKSTNIDDPEVKRLSGAIGQAFSALSPTNKVSIVQASHSLFYRLCQVFGVKTFYDHCKPILSMITDEVQKHNGDTNGNYIERHLAEIDSHKDDTLHISHGKRGLMHMRLTIFDLFLAGTDTISALMEWILLYLADRQDVQERIYHELIDNVGLETALNLDDRSKTPYSMAVVEEVLRLCPLGSSLGLGHMVTEDTYLHGRYFPKGTVVVPYGRLIHRNPKFFPDPDKFNPERFLDSQSGKFKGSKNMMPFSVGKRRCPGEQLAKSEAYLFLTNLVRKFKFQPLLGNTGKINFDYALSLALHPKNMKLRVELRQLQVQNTVGYT